MNIRFTSNSIENENLLMPVIVKILQENGGELTKQELERQIAGENDAWNQYVSHFNKSSKTGNNWRPFDFTMNYSLRHLKLAGYVGFKRMAPVKLTAKGLATDAACLTGEEVRAVSTPIWMEEAKQKRAAKSESGIQEGAEDEAPGENRQDFFDNEWRSELKRKLTEMNPYKFEIFCRGLLKKMGVSVDKEKGVQKSNDGGIDGYGYSLSANYRTERVALQCKRFREGQVGSKSIDEFKGAIIRHSAEYGIFITTSSFTKSATETAKTGNFPVTLIDGDKLIDLIESYEYKVRRVSYCIPDDEIWDD
ncbi:MAG: restriction endonuclease [Firmicutes bacterium]|nr:restriction endonuclease [Bacillota bacterium]